MTFTALHPDRGVIDSTAPDLGCGWGWEQVHRIRPRVPLTCPECGHGLHAKVSPAPRRLRYFAHDPGAPRCDLAEQDLDHHLLKLEIVSAARQAGAHAQLEASGTGWRADVLAITPGGRRVAWHVQLASITAADMRQRAGRMAAEDVAACWVALGTGERWLAEQPAVGVHPPDGAGEWRIAAGLLRLVAQTPDPARGLPPVCWNQVLDVTLDDFVAWVLVGKAVPRRFEENPRVWFGGWTAPAYLERARAVLIGEQKTGRRPARPLVRRGTR